MPPTTKAEPMPRPPHYLDESLNAAIMQTCDNLPTPTARLLVNLCGAIRALERQLEASNQETMRLRTLMNLYGIDTGRRTWEGATSTAEHPQQTAGTTK